MNTGKMSLYIFGGWIFLYFPGNRLVSTKAHFLKNSVPRKILVRIQPFNRTTLKPKHKVKISRTRQTQEKYYRGEYALSLFFYLKTTNKGKTNVK